MKRFITLLLLVNASVLAADQPEDGFYLRARGEPAPQIMGQDGQALFLGEKQTLKIQESKIFSRNNGNTRFYLSVTIPDDGSIGHSRHILIVAGTAYLDKRWGSSKPNTLSLYFDISEEKKAKQVSEYMKAPMVYRKHPQHNLLVTFTPSKEEFDANEEVTATLQITNVGTKSIMFMKGAHSRRAREHQYILSARHRGKQMKYIEAPSQADISSVPVLLEPGEVFKDTVSLSKWFAFDKAGKYEIHGSYYLRFKEPGVKSLRNIWEDYASAGFTVRIKETSEALNKPDADGGTGEKDSEPQSSAVQAVIPNELDGVTATIRSLGGTTLSEKPLRLEHTLKNNTAKPVVLYDLENTVMPEFEGGWGCVAGGPSSERDQITLSPGQSVSRWVDIARGEPTLDWPFSITVRSEGTGVGYKFMRKDVPTIVRSQVGYDDKIFTGKRDGKREPVLATPWIEIKVEQN